jgi:hypothetical protein
MSNSSRSQSVTESTLSSTTLLLFARALQASRGG